MRRLGRVTWISLALMLVLLFSGLATQAQGDPISLDGIENYVVVLSDGRLDVRYTITFTGRSSRTRRSANCQFPQPHTVTMLTVWPGWAISCQPVRWAYCIRGELWHQDGAQQPV